MKGVWGTPKGRGFESPPCMLEACDLANGRAYVVVVVKNDSVRVEDLHDLLASINGHDYFMK